MTKAEIVNEIAKTTGIDKTSVLAVVEQFMVVVKTASHMERTYISVASAHSRVKERAEKTARNISKEYHYRNPGT